MKTMSENVLQVTHFLLINYYRIVTVWSCDVVVFASYLTNY